MTDHSIPIAVEVAHKGDLPLAGLHSQGILVIFLFLNEHSIGMIP